MSTVNIDYLAKIRGSVKLYTKRKTSNVLEGGFQSVLRGRSLEFDDLKEYDFGDNVHDIDWKSSSRTGKVLVRRYVAEKKHNVLFIGDTGRKMTGHTSQLEQKSEVALMTFGTIAYLVDRQGADFSLAYGGQKGPSLHYFRSGTSYMEALLYEYRKSMAQETDWGVDRMLSTCVDRIIKPMVIFVITDLPGAAMITNRLAKKATLRNDLMVLCLDDAYYFGKRVFDVNRGRYENPFFLGSKRLKAQEEQLRANLEASSRGIFRQNRINMVMIRREEEILDRTMELFERYKNGVYG